MKTTSNKTKPESMTSRGGAKSSGSAKSTTKGTETTATANKGSRSNNPTGINQYTKKK